MVVFFHSSVESCGGDHGTSSRKEEVCLSFPKKGAKASPAQNPRQGHPLSWRNIGRVGGLVEIGAVFENNLLVGGFV